MDDSIPRSDRTLVYTDIDSGALKVRRWRVRVIAGVDSGQQFHLERGSLLVGSGTVNDLVLTDPRVSRSHLELRLREGGLQVRDLGSTNGTYEGSTRITDSILEGAAVLRLGDTRLAVEPAHRDLPIDTSADRLGSLVGRSPPMRQLFGTIKQISKSDVGVLLEGETGTGKEELAEQIHEHSVRHERPFVVVDCGALAAGLVESELFGHVRGAFTGAVANRDGAFEAADGGSIFLDEIGELPQDLQPKLLRALEQRQVRRVGGNKVSDVDVRVIAATSRDLSEAVAGGAFRPDLFYRLAVVRLRVPPLRERLEDLPLIVRTLVQRIAGRELVIPDVVVEQLAKHHWPGNVRELRNVLSHAIAVRPDSDILELPALPTGGVDLTAPSDSEIGDYREAKKHAVAQFEVQYLARLLERHEWNVSAAAREAGVDRNYLHRLIKRHGLKRG